MMLDFLDASVGTAAIDNDVLEVTAGLFYHGGKGACQSLTIVVVDGYNGDFHIRNILF